MEYIAFPLRIDAESKLARSSGAEENLLCLLKTMLTTPTSGWSGLPDFGVRDALAELPFKSNVRTEIIKRMNASLCELGIDWVGVKLIEVDPASNAYEAAYLLTLSHKDNNVGVTQVKL